MGILRFLGIGLPKKSYDYGDGYITVGDKWIVNDIDPFNDIVIKVVDIKDDYIQYKYCGFGGLKSSSHIFYFVRNYKPMEKK